MYLPAPNATSTCTNCGLTARSFFHYLNLRGIERHLCTSCVLRLHPSSFCPSCLEFFDHPLTATSSATPNRFLSCVKCSSLTHLRCLPSPHPSPSTFLCPPCSSPSPSSYSFFPIDHSAPQNLDTSLASALLCASKIAFASLNRYHSAARAKADRSVRESAAARKKARDALDHLSVVEKTKRAAEVSGSRNLGIHKVTNPVSVNAHGNGFGGNNGSATATGTSEDVKLERVQSDNGGR
ncbi:hypothetical protein PIB30_012544 [Stylosanthes scabra]|uniref:Zinc finger PHD-type domain-containing protein n=1 Tax=Stylosanthes scabra TaxID=79078 RepID=A0ABU6V5P1_9FABA|nr:hypothetical protein [Stylosanthes scabra]